MNESKKEAITQGEETTTEKNESTSKKAKVSSNNEECVLLPQKTDIKERGTRDFFLFRIASFENVNEITQS